MSKGIDKFYFCVTLLNMLWAEYKSLLDKERNRTLKSRTVEFDAFSVLSLKKKSKLISRITKFIETEGSFDNFEEHVQLLDILQNYYYLFGDGSAERPYEVITEFGQGKFLDSRLLFQDKKYPSYIQKQQCHNNCYDFARKYQGNCKVVTGIVYRKEAFLHTVINIDGVVIDFNYNLQMTEDLYYSLFNFEIINIVENKKIKENHKYLCDNVKSLPSETTYAELVACYDEVLEYINTHSKTNNI